MSFLIFLKNEIKTAPIGHTMSALWAIQNILEMCSGHCSRRAAIATSCVAAVFLVNLYL